MEKPVSNSADDIRDEKTRVLRCMPPILPQDCVLGQYTAAAEAGHPRGYQQEPGVPANSRTPTFAACVAYVNNDRWSGVPFVLKAGKALNERKAEVRALAWVRAWGCSARQQNTCVLDGPLWSC